MLFSSKNNNKQCLAAAVLATLAFVTVVVVDLDLNSLKDAIELRGHRRVSINLGGGDCIWTAPDRSPSESIDFEKTLLVGFPSGDKRMAWIQMESLAGLPTQNDWDRHYNGYTNSPFIKTNYPHPAGTWSWDNDADRVALAVQYIRRSMVEYADIMSYIDAPATYDDKKNSLESQYGKRDDFNSFYEWRDTHVLSEIYLYGWYIDYWMEGGLYRDPYSHSIIDQDYWALWHEPTPVTSKKEKCQICHRTRSPKNPWLELEISCNAVPAHIDHGDYEGACTDAAQDPTFTEPEETNLVHDHDAGVDYHCSSVSGGCKPQVIISSDKLRDYTEGPAETALIGEYLLTTSNVADYVIDREAWDCIWDKVIDKNMGPASFKDRDLSEDPNFSPFMLGEMMYEVNRLITKYSGDEWSGNKSAERLVSLLSEHIVLLQTEYDDVVSGRRTLETRDIFGPNEVRPSSNVVLEAQSATS